MASDAPQTDGSPRIDFYILPGAQQRERARFACGLIEKAYLAGQRVFVWLEEPAALASFDELLWTFADRSFVPHESAQAPPQWAECPVLLGCHPPPPGCDLLVNLAADPAATELGAPARIVEILDADPGRRQAGRDRYRRYRERELNPQTHHIAVDETP